GMIVAGIGAYLGVSILLVGGWLALTVAIWRTNFFEGKSKKVQWIGNIFISLCILAGLILVMAFFKTPREKSRFVQQSGTSSWLKITGYELTPLIVGKPVAINIKMRNEGPDTLKVKGTFTV